MATTMTTTGGDSQKCLPPSNQRLCDMSLAKGIWVRSSYQLVCKHDTDQWLWWQADREGRRGFHLQGDQVAGHLDLMVLKFHCLVDPGEIGIRSRFRSTVYYQSWAKTFINCTNYDTWVAGTTPVSLFDCPTVFTCSVLISLSVYNLCFSAICQHRRPFPSPQFPASASGTLLVFWLLMHIIPVLYCLPMLWRLLRTLIMIFGLAIIKNTLSLCVFCLLSQMFQRQKKKNVKIKSEEENKVKTDIRWSDWKREKRATNETFLSTKKLKCR